MPYNPNFNDPRVQRRIRRALGWATGVLSDTKPHSWSTREIDRYFGSQRNDISRWLRRELLTTVNEHWNKDTGVCKTYLLNRPAADRLYQQLNSTPSDIVVEVAQTEFAPELESGVFEYTDKSNRLWHPLQRYRRQYKQQILSQQGYQHQYDIQCCAPTLLHQYSTQIPEIVSDDRWLQGPMDLYLFAVRRYLEDRQQVRSLLAEELELPVEAVKEVINALFAGAQISQHPESDIYHILAGDSARIEFLKQHSYIQELRSDIKTIWEYIRPVMPRRTRTQKSGRERLCPITSRQKWHVYFEQERRVLSAVRDYLDELDIRYFLEHDGWTSEQAIDQQELISRICEQTGFRVAFDYQQVKDSTGVESTHQISPISSSLFGESN